jgi:hypothetical protein
MPYRVPGAYARFVKSASTVNNVGATRALGLIGTGANYFEVYNEAIKKSDSQSYDTLAYKNVFEIISVTDKALSNGSIVKGSKEFEEGKAFTLKEGNKIAWNTIQPGEYAITAQANERSLKLKEQIEAVVNDNQEYAIVDGSYTLEITYLEDAFDHSDSAHINCGCYRVTDNSSKKIIGEWGVSNDFNTTAVPGLKLKITDLFVPDTTGESITKVGDSVTITTIAAKTEIEPQVVFDETVPGYSQKLRESFVPVNKEEVKSAEDYKYFLVTDSDEVISGTYDLEVVDSATKEVQITRVSDNTVIYGPKKVDAVSEYLNIIPGITFLLPDFDKDVVNTGDTVRIVTTAATFGEAIAENNVYYISYKYKKAIEDYEPKVFYSYDDVVQEYGNYDVTASSIVTNSLALGAELAFKAGVNPVVCVQAKNDSDYEMKAAIDKLTKDVAGVDNVNAIVPLTTSTNVGSYAQSHVNTMSAESGRHERMVFLSSYAGQKINKAATAADKTLGMKQQAEAYSDERVVYVTPGRVSYDVKNLSTGRINTRTLPGCYLALGVATVAFTHDPAEPLTRKKIACGFNSLLDTYTEVEKNALAESGCCVVEEKSNGIRVRHGITTKDDEIITTEITYVQIKDYVIAQVRKSCDEMYVGIKNLPAAKTNIKFTVNSILSQFVSQEIILSYTGPTVKDSADDPREVLVNFEIEAVSPLNYITISFGMSA